MKTGWIKSGLIILALATSQATVVGQTTGDTPDHRLYLLCKTWGFVKYNHQRKCEFHWDEILNGSVNQVLQSTTNSSFNAAILNMLNQVGNNEVVADPGTRPDTNLLVKTDWFSDPWLAPQVRTLLTTFASRIFPDRSSCLVKVNTGNPDAFGYIDFTHDSISMPVDYSIESHRLTVLFYYWNVINYFFPYRNLMDQPWDQTLIEFIPIFRTSRNELEFQFNFMKLVHHINDSHGSTVSNLIYDAFWKGNYRPKIQFERIENQCVVRKFENIEGIEPGDILTAIDGKSIPEIEDSLKHYLAYSTEAVRYRATYDLMLRGTQGSEIVFRLINRRGQPYSTVATRDLWTNDWIYWKYGVTSENSYKITDCGYGYVQMGKLMPAEVPAMYAALKSAPAIIFDLRNYPNGTIVNLAPLFFRSRITSAVYHLPALNPGYHSDSYNYLPGWYNDGSDLGNFGTWNNPECYSGKVYILVNEDTQSHAEYTCQYLSYHPNATVIGTQTSGADGNVSRLSLPGGIKTYFTSLGWYYADGYQQQRNGVKIDTVVAPTIRGVREGKDEILLAALKCISGMDPKPVKTLDVSVYPNPAISGEVKISLTAPDQSEIRLSLVDLTGKTIFQEKRLGQAGEQTLFLDLPQTTPGLYLLKAQTNRESFITRLVIR